MKKLLLAAMAAMTLAGSASAGFLDVYHNGLYDFKVEYHYKDGRVKEYVESFLHKGGVNPVFRFASHTAEDAVSHIYLTPICAGGTTHHFPVPEDGRKNVVSTGDCFNWEVRYK